MRFVRERWRLLVVSEFFGGGKKQFWKMIDFFFLFGFCHVVTDLDKVQ